jgi:adenylate cyclase
MAKEIEHKFLVASEAWRAAARPGTRYVQGYLSAEPGRTVRVRVAGDRGYLTVKGRAAGPAGASRDEFEYEVPLDDARQMLAMCGALVSKTRYVVPHEGHDWEVDVFDEANAGLVVAEIELRAEGERFALPPWAGADVTSDGRYSNASLSAKPYSSWAEKKPQK